MPDPNSKKPLTLEQDRRRSPRYSCGGLVQIVCLPSDGILLPGKIHDLSLGGCSVETVSPLECGVRTEILVRVNTSSFRAVGQVRAVRGSARMGMQFLQLSVGGQDMLVELIRELTRQQAIATMLRAARREPDPKQWNECRAALLEQSFPVLGRILASQSSEESSLVVDWPSLDGEPREIPLDLFI